MALIHFNQAKKLTLLFTNRVPGRSSKIATGNNTKRPPVTSTNSIQLLSLASSNPSKSGISNNEITANAHYEANYKEKTLIEINRNRLNRKIQKLEETIAEPMIVLDKLKTLSWSGIPSCKLLVRELILVL